MNYKLIAVKFGESVKYDTSINEINRIFKALTDLEIIDYKNDSITSTRSQLIYSWIMTIGNSVLNDANKQGLIQQAIFSLVDNVNVRDRLVSMINVKPEVNTMNDAKANVKVFISHSSKDKKIVDDFIDEILCVSLGIKHNEILCTSSEGSMIESGEDWREKIKENMGNSQLIFLILTSHYKSSEICLNEMGAAWTFSVPVVPVILNPINYENVGVLTETKKIEVLNDDYGLDRIKDKTMKILKIPAEQVKSDKWTKQKNEFLAKISQHLIANPFPPPISESEVQRLDEENKKLNEKIISCKSENDRLVNIMKDISKLKDKKAIEEINVKHGMATSFDTFKKIIQKISKCLKKFDSIVIAVIYQDYSCKRLTISFKLYQSEIEKAIAKSYIYCDQEDGSLHVNEDQTREMKELFAALHEIDCLLEKPHDDLLPLYEAKHKSPLDPANLNFWEELFGVDIERVLE